MDSPKTMDPKATTFSIQRAKERYCADHGWLSSCFSFSFADYYDPKNLNWGALRVLNDDTIAPELRVPDAPAPRYGDPHLRAERSARAQGQHG